MRPALVVLTKFRSNVTSQYIVTTGCSGLCRYPSLASPQGQQFCKKARSPCHIGGQLASPGWARRSFNTSQCRQEDDKAMEERLQRLKRDFEAQKAEEEAKRKAEEDRLRREKEERERKEREALEAKQAREREAREARERAEREEREERERLAAVASARQSQTVKAMPKPTETPSSRQSAKPEPSGQGLAQEDTKQSTRTAPSTNSGQAPPTISTPPSSADLKIPSPAPSQKPTTRQPPPPPTDKQTSSYPSPSTPNPIDWTTWAQNLPSHTASLRSSLTKRLHRSMEHLLTLAATYSHRLNTYTGTDYSSISSLRSAITAQESLVRTALASVNAAKDTYSASFIAQAASQKEVVQLLERKHSWSATDLERYMSLIRSEHVNEQAVQRAKEALADKEKALEEARAGLEKSERRQYHEEQIWSDTIRRNSTWVTFGLMGLNIFLLLSSLLVFEPWRRRRLVREIRSALDEKAVAAGAASVPPPVGAAVSAGVAGNESAAVQSVSARETSPHSAAASTSTHLPKPAAPAVEDKGTATNITEAAVLSSEADAALPDALILPSTTADPPTPDLDLTPSFPTTSDNLRSYAPSSTTSSTSSEPLSSPQPPPVPTSPPSSSPQPAKSRFSLPPFPSLPSLPSFPSLPTSSTYHDALSLSRAYWADLFSERPVTLQKVDLTARMLEGAAVGAAVMGVVGMVVGGWGGW